MNEDFIGNMGLQWEPMEPCLSGRALSRAPAGSGRCAHIQERTPLKGQTFS